MNAGKLWYAYDTPYKASANTGFEVSDALLLYFVVDAAGDAYLVVTADKPEDVAGGALEVLVDSPDLAGGTAGVAFYDDTRAMDETAYAEADGCDAYDGTECYAYDATRGEGYMRWAWNDCCTDGMVYGPLPPTGFCFQALVQSAVGLDAGVRLGTTAYNDRGDLPSGATPTDASAAAGVRATRLGSSSPP